MAMNPDDLLIFKVREEDKGAPKQKGKKAAAQAPLQQSKPGFFSPRPKPEQQQQKQAPQKPAREEEIPGPEPVVSANGEEEYYVAPEPSEATNPIDYVSEAAEFAGGEGIVAKQGGKKKVLKKREHMDPRKIAQHMSCELHPWRRAYAICDYCKRAFCYEDILEVGGKYYCLDDVDKVPEAVRRNQVVKYNNLGMLASILYMVAFIVFFYYSYSSVLVLLDAIQKIGLPLFMTQLNLSRELLLGESVLALAALGTAISILMSSGSSFKLSALVSIISVGVFGYQYSIPPAQTYVIAFAGLTFVAFLLLSYSRVSTESMPEEEAILEESLAGASSF
jgi:hypothetical protein